MTTQFDALLAQLANEHADVERQRDTLLAGRPLMPSGSEITGYADDHTATNVPKEWLKAAIDALDSRFDRDWTPGPISIAVVVFNAAERVSQGLPPSLWADEDEDEST